MNQSFLEARKIREILRLLFFIFFFFFSSTLHPAPSDSDETKRSKTSAFIRHFVQLICSIRAKLEPPRKRLHFANYSLPITNSFLSLFSPSCHLFSSPVFLFLFLSLSSFFFLFVFFFLVFSHDDSLHSRGDFVWKCRLVTSEEHRPLKNIVTSSTCCFAFLR